MAQRFKFFANKECEFYPCHKMDGDEEFNCLFCYCPLYALGDRCGGNYSFLDNGVKDCSNCVVPHKKDAYDYIIGRFDDIIQLTKR